MEVLSCGEYGGAHWMLGPMRDRNGRRHGAGPQGPDCNAGCRLAQLAWVKRSAMAKGSRHPKHLTTPREGARQGRPVGRGHVLSLPQGRRWVVGGACRPCLPGHGYRLHSLSVRKDGAASTDSLRQVGTVPVKQVAAERQAPQERSQTVRRRTRRSAESVRALNLAQPGRPALENKGFGPSRLATGEPCWCSKLGASGPVL